MYDTNMVLTILFDRIRYCQTAISVADETAFGAKLRQDFRQLQLELDSLEAAVRTLAECRGLEFDALPPIRHLLNHGRTRLFLHFRNTDADAAERVIYAGMESIIHVTKAKNRWERPESRTDYLVYRFLECMSSAVRGLQKYL